MSTPAFRDFLVRLYVSFLHKLVLVVMVRILLETACSHSLVAHKRSELLQQTMLRNRPAYTKAKWQKLTIGHFWSVYRRQRKYLRNKLNAAAMHVNAPNRVFMCVFPKDCLANIIVQWKYFPRKKRSSKVTLPQVPNILEFLLNLVDFLYFI